MKLFEYKEWKDQYYDHLLGYLYDMFKYDGLKKVYDYKIDNLTYITNEELKTILNKFGEMSIFQSQLNIEIMKDKMCCEYCPLEELRRVIREKYFIKIFKKKPSDHMLEESLEILVISEVIKIHEDDRYKSIIKKFLD